MNLSVAILVGGLATRIRPLTDDIPKALVPINGKPFILHQLDLLQNAGIKKAVICAWYRGIQIETLINKTETIGMDIMYSYDGEKPLGTGGAVLKALPFLQDHFFVLYGDSYLPINYKKIIAKFLRLNQDGLMTVYHNQGLGDTSNVHFNNGKILSYDKDNRTPKMEYIDYGLGILRKNAFAPYSSDQYLDLAKIYQDLLADDNLAAYEVQQKFFEIGSFKGIKELEKYLTDKKGV